MAYGLIVLVAAIALTAVYVLGTEAALWAKALVLVLLLGSFAWRYGFLMRVALAIYLSFYFTYCKARSDNA
jgi:hypothetical protein